MASAKFIRIGKKIGKIEENIKFIEEECALYNSTEGWVDIEDHTLLESIYFYKLVFKILSGESIDDEEGRRFLYSAEHYIFNHKIISDYFEKIEKGKKYFPIVTFLDTNYDMENDVDRMLSDTSSILNKCRKNNEILNEYSSRYRESLYIPGSGALYKRAKGHFQSEI